MSLYGLSTDLLMDQASPWHPWLILWPQMWNAFICPGKKTSWIRCEETAESEEWALPHWIRQMHQVQPPVLQLVTSKGRGWEEVHVLLLHHVRGGKTAGLRILESPLFCEHFLQHQQVLAAFGNCLERVCLPSSRAFTQWGLMSQGHLHVTSIIGFATFWHHSQHDCPWRDLHTTDQGKHHPHFQLLSWGGSLFWPPSTM